MAYEVEQLCNNAITTLSAGIDNVVTSLSIASAVGFPTRGTFRVIIGSEILKVTAISGTTLTVTRGDGSTTAASHSSGDQVTAIISKEAMQQLLRDAVGRPLYTYPLLSSFAWINQGSGTVDDTDLGLYLKAPFSGAGTPALRILEKAVLATPYTITTRIIPTFEGIVSFHNTGIGFRESSSGKISTISIGVSATDISLNTERWNSPTSFNASMSTIAASYKLCIHKPWLRIRDDGTSIYWDWSNDGYTFVNIRSELRNAFFTTAPSRALFYADAENASKFCAVRLLSWLES